MISKYGNNLVYLQSNREIHQDDVEFIILFFENTKLSGGYDIVKHKLIKSNLLEINYKYNESKQEILKRYHFNYMDGKYQFIVTTEPQLKKIEQPSRINNMLVFGNIDVPNTNMLELYVDYLIQDTNQSNSIKTIEKSIFFPGIFYIYFQNDVYFENILKRLSKKPQLRNKDVKIYEAFELAQLLITSKVKNLNLNDYEDEFDRHLMSKDQFYVLPFKKNSPYLILNFNQKSLLKEFRSKNYFMANIDNLVFENCYNYELLDEYACNYLPTIPGNVKPTDKNDVRDNQMSSNTSESESSSSSDNHDESDNELDSPQSKNIKQEHTNEENEKLNENKEVTMNEEPFATSNITGIIRSFSLKRFFGFIVRDDNQEDVFFNGKNFFNYVKERDENTIQHINFEGQKVRFDVINRNLYGKKSKEALRIVKLNGESFFNGLCQLEIDDKDIDSNDDSDWCHFCFVYYVNEAIKKQHLNSFDHLRRKNVDIVDSNLFCKVCRFLFDERHEFEKHLEENKHKINSKRYQKYENSKTSSDAMDQVETNSLKRKNDEDSSEESNNQSNIYTKFGLNNLKDAQLVDKNATGTIVNFKVFGLFGFINNDSDDDQIWFHARSFINFNYHRDTKHFRTMDLVCNRVRYDIFMDLEKNRRMALNIRNENDSPLFEKIDKETEAKLRESSIEGRIKIEKRLLKNWSEDLDKDCLDKKWCHYCYFKYTSVTKEEHLNEDEHNRRVSLKHQLLDNKYEAHFFCKVCYIDFYSKSALCKHQMSDDHLKLSTQFFVYMRSRENKSNLVDKNKNN